MMVGCTIDYVDGMFAFSRFQGTRTFHGVHMIFISIMTAMIAFRLHIYTFHDYTNFTSKRVVILSVFYLGKMRVLRKYLEL